MSMGDMSVKKKETHANRETEEGQRLRKRPRRSKICKNKAEAESQRMAHIAVERNRRRLINDYLSALRSLMPPSYLNKGDQASIIGGAINFVKELEHLVETLEARKGTNQHLNVANVCQLHSPFAGLYGFTQCVSCSARTDIEGKVAADNKEVVTDVKVTMVESHANVKVVSKRWPRQMLKMVIGLQSLKLTILHLYVTTIDEMVLYTLSLKVEEDCQFDSVDKIAEAIYQMMGRI
ncbi:hypothetical protein HPP92_001950 [Vanilla planifolia]|uniref:BHLH domain-containing protein n=1 Tax=Vanilla planifolia TaxID=51239 RepID=A0A835VM18_VANPL|nr:hypothetical protein HPP92_001950 [Vanilla planifolia]